MQSWSERERTFWFVVWALAVRLRIDPNAKPMSVLDCTDEEDAGTGAVRQFSKERRYSNCLLNVLLNTYPNHFSHTLSAAFVEGLSFGPGWKKWDEQRARNQVSKSKLWVAIPVVSGNLIA